MGEGENYTSLIPDRSSSFYQTDGELVYVEAPLQEKAQREMPQSEGSKLETVTLSFNDHADLGIPGQIVEAHAGPSHAIKPSHFARFSSFFKDFGSKIRSKVKKVRNG